MPYMTYSISEDIPFSYYAHNRHFTTLHSYDDLQQ